MSWKLASDIETTAIRLQTVVSTLQILVLDRDQRDPDFAAALAGLRDTVAEQSQRLEKIAGEARGKAA